MSRDAFVVTPTIDVEGMHGAKPYEQMAYGHIQADEDWGALRLARIFQRYNVRATFFLDVYEHVFWGEKTIADLGTALLDLGQDVQLHTHPAWRDDVNDGAFPELREMKRSKGFLSQDNDFMSKLSYDEQVHVLEHGKDCFQRWFGVVPVAHRSGGYATNEFTPAALRDTGFILDSSMYREHPNSKLWWVTNQIVRRDDLWELPVSLAWLLFGKEVSSRGLYRRLMKLDIDTSTVAELKAFVRQAQQRNIAYLNLFMHSYSLLTFDAFYRHFSPCQSTEKRLENFLQFCYDDPDICFRSCADWAEYLSAAERSHIGTDEIPELSATWHIARLGLNKSLRHIRSRLGC